MPCDRNEAHPHSVEADLIKSLAMLSRNPEHKCPRVQTSFASLRGNTVNEKANLWSFFLSCEDEYLRRLCICAYNTTRFGKEQALPLRKPASQRLPVPPGTLVNNESLACVTRGKPYWSLKVALLPSHLDSLPWLVYLDYVLYFVSKPKPDLRRQLQSNEPRWAFRLQPSWLHM